MTGLRLDKIKHIHFVGIGGVSMSGLAEMLRFRGYNITGSDSRGSNLTQHLESLGIKVFIGQKYEHVPSNCELVVFSAAVKPDNPEIKAALDFGIKTVDRAELLGAIMDMYKYSIGVSGTHGKTTTTSMVSEILLEAGFDPSLNVGGIFTSIGSNFRNGQSEYFVAESCEYFDSFSKFYPYIGVILNVERDHTDYFKTMEQLENSFHKFASNIHENGALIINANLDCFDKIVKGLNCRVITFGEGGEFSAKNISLEPDGTSQFDVYHNSEFYSNIKLNVSGLHNIENALAACAACYFLGVDVYSTQKAMKNFRGAKRRFEIKGKFNGVTVVDDYAHHPTEVAATLAAAKKYDAKNIIAVFQPHTYSRTKDFIDRFAASFDDADMVILLDIYSARESYDDSIHSKHLADKIRQNVKEVYYFESFKLAENFILENCSQGDLLITLGAGDVNKLGENLLLTTLSTLSTEN